jgi:hypothetical protein
MREALVRSVGIRYAAARRSYSRYQGRDSLRKLRSAWEGKPALVVGNGPSLNRTPLDAFLGVRSIGMNKIDLIYPAVRWRPDIVLCVNNLVATQHQDAWMRSGVPVYLSWKCRRMVRRELRSKFVYFLSLADQAFSTDVAEGVGSSDTVTYTALQFAHFLGADPVVIVGVDHSFAGANEGRENMIEKRVGADRDHFHPAYFADGQSWGVPNLRVSEQGYRLAREAFETDGRRIYDATVGGKLTVFEKITIDDARNLVSKR